MKIKLAYWKARYEAWQFGRKLVRVKVIRSCGHPEYTHVRNREIEHRVAWHESLLCEECTFCAITDETTAVRRKLQSEIKERDA